MKNIFKMLKCKHTEVIKSVKEIGNWQDCSVDYLHITKCKNCGRVVNKRLSNKLEG